MGRSCTFRGRPTSNERLLVSVDRNGSETLLPVDAASYDWVRFSPDGTRVLMTRRDSETVAVWVYSFERDVLTRVTSNGGGSFVPSWWPDGRSILYTTSGKGVERFQLVRQAADGTGEPELLVTSPTIGGFRAYEFTPDGKTLLVDYGRDIGTVSMDEPAVEPFISTPAIEEGPTLSPDGQWIAYASARTGRFEIYVERFPELGDRQQISSDGGSEPLWSRGGDEIFYRSGQELMVVPVEVGTSLRLGVPRVVFDNWHYQNQFRQRAYDVSPDGRRIVLIRSDPADRVEPPSYIRVVDNWFRELNEVN